MATSGNFITNDSGYGGGNYYSRMIFEWWQTGSGISGSVGYHNISYHLKTWGGVSNYWQYFYNGSMNVDGAGYSWGTTQAFSAGATVFGDYSKTLYTDSAGNRSFGASAQGGIYTSAINTSGSGSWSLDNIPLHATITGATGNITDETSTYYATYNNPAGAAVDVYIDLPNLGAGGLNHHYNYPSGATESFQTDIVAIQQAMVNTNSTTVRYVVHDNVGGADNWSWIDSTLTIKNDTGQANPDFTDFTFADVNPTTVAVTGNSQYIIAGQSDLQVTVPVAKAAVPKKYANMDHYSIAVAGYSYSATYSSSADVTKDVGYVYFITGSQAISVKAVDSRGNGTSVTKNATFLSYDIPVVTSTATRANSFDDAVVLNIAGTVSSLNIAGTDKNFIKSTGTGARNKTEYCVSVDGAAYGAWIDVASTMAASGGAAKTNVTSNAPIVIAAQGTASSNHSYNIQVRITDGLYSTVQTISVPIGRPIFRIGLDGNVYNNEQKLLTAGNMSSSVSAYAVTRTWMDLQPASGWAGFDGSALTTPSDIPTTTTGQYRYLRATKDAMNVVHLTGLLKNTSSTTAKAIGSIIVMLPAGFRPGHKLLFPSLTSDLITRIDIDVNGLVTLGGGNTVSAGGYLSFNGISFIAEQ